MLPASFSSAVFAFTVYSFIGWVCETIWCSVAAGKFINRGFLSGPFCPIYGFAALLIQLFAVPLQAWPPLVFLLCLVVASGVEYFTGWLLEALFQTRWWDYSSRRFNIKGRVCLRNALLFGLLGTAAVYFVQPLVGQLIALFSPATQRVIAALAVAVFALDLVRTIAALTGLQEKLQALSADFTALRSLEKEYDWFRVNDLPGSLARLRQACRDNPENERAAAVLARIDAQAEKQGGAYRIVRAFPNMQPKALAPALETVKAAWLEKTPTLRAKLHGALASFKKKAAGAAKDVAPFAQGLSVQKMVWVFGVGCVIGYVVETLFCMVTRGKIESRQGMLYGPFNQVYGFGAVLMALLLYRLGQKGTGWLFFGSALLGGVFEYIVSWVQELAFGTVSWEYSGQPFSFGGRTSLLYMFFWGILGTVYIKYIYPWLSNLIERIPKRPGRFFTWVIAIGLSANMLLSAAAVARWTDRRHGVPAGNAVAVFLDEHYPDDMLAEIYPNMTLAEDK